MDDIFRKIDEHTQKYRVSHWEGTFRDYLPMVIENPKLAQLAHARIYDMVRSYGVDIDDQGNVHGTFKPTGIRPTFLADLKHMGLDLPTTHFDPNRAL